MFDIVLDTLMLPIEREVAADIRKRLSSLSWRPNQIAVGSVLLRQCKRSVSSFGMRAAYGGAESSTRLEVFSLFGPRVRLLRGCCPLRIRAASQRGYGSICTERVDPYGWILFPERRLSCVRGKSIHGTRLRSRH